MDFDDSGVNHGVFHVWRVGAGLEKPGENVRFDPVAVALENCVPVAEERRKITPRASRPHDPKDRFDEAAVVASAAPGVRRLTQTMRLHLRPLGVCQYESFHPKLESQPSRRWNLDSQQTLVEMILDLVERDPALFRKFDAAAAAIHDDDKTLGARLRKMIDSATRTGHFVDYRGAPGWAAQVDSVLDGISGLASGARAGLARELVERAIDRIAGAIEQIDDSDGHCSMLLGRARDIHLAAVRGVRPEPARLARDLFA